MIYAETGDVDNATNHLIEVLRLDPSDSWNWVMLGNLHAGGKGDPKAGEKFIRKALELNPRDAWALNSLATFTEKAGELVVDALLPKKVWTQFVIEWMKNILLSFPRIVENLSESQDFVL